MTAVAFAVTFSPVAAGEKVGAVEIGPRSNTGQKGGALIDYLTVVIPRSRIEERGLGDLRNLLGALFGFRGEVVNGPLRERPWQFYPHSAVLVDREGELVGRIGAGGNGDTICISLSGMGTRWVRNWHTCAMHLQALRGKISRCDVAFDDYEGECLDVHVLRDRASAGDFAQGGRPPASRFLSDEGNGSGCTLYVGGKGHKELCVYEKGKQLGVPGSKWVRAEVRLYGKHTVLPFDVLTNPLTYLLGSYTVLAEIIKGVCTRLRTVRKQVEVSAEALVTWAKRQLGPSLHVLREALGSEWAEFVQTRIVREGTPGRFRGIAKGDRLTELLRSELQCLSA